MIEAKGKIKSGVAPPGAFRIQKHRPRWATQDILRADIAMHQRALAARGDSRDIFQNTRQIRMRAGGCQQIGFQADGVENLICRESFGQRGMQGGMGVDGCDAPPDFASESGIRMAIAQPRLPDRMILWRKECHGEATCRLILPQQLGHRAGQSAIRFGQPACLINIAHNGRAPIGGDFQLGQCAFDANIAAIWQAEAPDIGRNAARQRLTLRALTGREQPHGGKARGDGFR